MGVGGSVPDVASDVAPLQEPPVPPRKGPLVVRHPQLRYSPRPVLAVVQRRRDLKLPEIKQPKVVRLQHLGHSVERRVVQVLVV